MSGIGMHKSRVSREEHNLVIEKMKKEDIDQVILIEQDSFSDPWSKKSFSDDLDNPLALPLTVKSDNKVVGYACLWQIERELQIGNIAVAREHRGKGIGKFLMKQITEQAIKRECRSISLDVRESNKTAIELYEKFGFAVLGRRKSYYRLPKEDALVMLKAL